LRLLDWLRRGKGPEEAELPLRDRIRHLESDMAQLQLDWETTYGKVRRALATLARRQAREAGGEDATSSENGKETDWADPQVRGRALAEARRRFGRQQ